MDRRVTSPTWDTPPPCKQAVMSKHSGSKERGKLVVQTNSKVMFYIITSLGTDH